MNPHSIARPVLRTLHTVDVSEFPVCEGHCLVFPSQLFSRRVYPESFAHFPLQIHDQPVAQVVAERRPVPQARGRWRRITSIQL